MTLEGTILGFSQFANINFGEISDDSNTFLPLRENSSDFSAICLSVRQINHWSTFSVLASLPPMGYLGADRIFGPLRERADRRNFANPNKTETAVSATRVHGPPQNAKNVSAFADSAC